MTPYVKHISVRSCHFRNHEVDFFGNELEHRYTIGEQFQNLLSLTLTHKSASVSETDLIKQLLKINSINKIVGSDAWRQVLMEFILKTSNRQRLLNKKNKSWPIIDKLTSLRLIVLDLHFNEVANRVKIMNYKVPTEQKHPKHR